MKKSTTKHKHILTRTLEDKFVIDCLMATSLLNGKEPYYLVGGIATQTYIPNEYRRPTADVDLSLVRPLNDEGFRLITDDLIKFLYMAGYDSEIRKSSRAYQIELVNREGEAMAIEFLRRNEGNFERHKERLEREFKNAREKIILGKDKVYLVCSPEDIVIPKLVRSIDSIKRDNDLIRHIPSKLIGISSEEAKNKLSYIEQLREEAQFSPADPKLSEKLRFVADLYDVRVLFEIVGFDHDYFHKAASDWESLEESAERDLIFSKVLPDFDKK